MHASSCACIIVRMCALSITTNKHTSVHKLHVPHVLRVLMPQLTSCVPLRSISSSLRIARVIACTHAPSAAINKPTCIISTRTAGPCASYQLTSCVPLRSTSLSLRGVKAPCNRPTSITAHALHVLHILHVLLSQLTSCVPLRSISSSLRVARDTISTSSSTHCEKQATCRGVQRARVMVQVS